MTTTTTGTNGSQAKYVFAAFAAVGILIAIMAVSQWSAPQGQQNVSAPVATQTVEATEAAVPSAIPNGLTQALNDGKLDTQVTQAEASAAAVIAPAPEQIVVDGEGGTFDALIAGKFDMDFTSNDPYHRYVRGTTPLSSPTGLTKALNDGKFDETSPSIETLPAAPRTPTLSGGPQE